MISKGIIAIVTVILLSCILVSNSSALAADADNGARIFSIHCAGCHPNGNNIIRRGKSLKKKALHRYKMDSVEAITDIVANGKNNMSAYRDKLSQQEIENVAAYVLEQAEKGWR